MNRKITTVVATVALATTLAACGSSSNKGGSSSNKTIAGKLIMGGPPEFQTRRLPGLQSTYGVTFQSFKPLDTGGPLTVQALKNGQVDAADIFTTDPAIKANHFVVLQDPKAFFGAQNVIPLIAKSKATTGVAQVLDFIQSKLTTDALINLRTAVEVNKQDPVQAAEAWLSQFSAQRPPATLNKGVTITVGSANFPENQVIAQIYAIALQATGATVHTKFNIGAREKYVPAMLDGSIDLIPDYSGSVLTYFDKNATAATEADVLAALPKALPAKLTVLKDAQAQDNDAIVVTQATAQKYHLTSIADLAKPA
jgi:osmoprotectant transport system substrate-binding protein